MNSPSLSILLETPLLANLDDSASRTDLLKPL